MKCIQNFNYHTHTERCRHAEKGYDDEEYVKEAFETGIKFLAFTDHINLNEIYREYAKAKSQMPNSSEQEQIEVAMRRIKYPNAHFGRILLEYDNIKVVFGIDAHLKGQIQNNEISYKIANEILGKTMKRLNFVGNRLETREKK